MKTLYGFISLGLSCFCLSTFAGDTNLLDPERDHRGRLLEMDWRDAVEQCASKDSRLPSARELALFAMRLGAKGISEIVDGRPDSSYFLIETKETDGTTDSFYFSREGYQDPPGEIASYWSSSVSKYKSDERIYFASVGLLMESWEKRLYFECVPVTANKIVKKAVILENESSYEMELWGRSGLISKTAAEYSDDVDAVSYFSETADVNVYFNWAEMQNEGEADGEIVMNVSAAKSKSFHARCKSVSI